MLKLLLFSLLGFLVATPAVCWNHVPDKKTFWETVDTGDSLLIAFVAPWTERSKALEPEWLAAAAQTDKNMMSIDCTKLTRVCRNNGIYSYPVIRHYRGDHDQVRYRGPRTTAGLLSFIERFHRETITELDENSITPFQSIDESVFIAYLRPEDKQQREAYTDLAEKNYHRFAFGISNAIELAGNASLSAPSLVYYEKEPGLPKVFAGDWGIRSLEKFMEASVQPVIGELTRKNELKLIHGENSLVYIFVQNESQRIKYRKELRLVAMKYDEFLNFVTIDATEYAHMAPSLGLKEGKFPALALQIPADGRVFPFDQEKDIRETAIDEFIVDIVNGKVKAYDSEAVVAEPSEETKESKTVGGPRDEL